MFIVYIIISVFSILLAFAAHEFSHALTAYKLGDPTPKYEGRLTLNPIRHLDLVGSLVLLLSFATSQGTLVLGWGKPVQFNSEAMKDPIVDGGLVAAAGPFANLIVAIIVGLPVKLGMVPIPLLEDILAIFAGVNIALFVFNMIPFPPLDGWKVLQIVMPRSLAYEMKSCESRFGLWPMYTLMGLIFFFGAYIIGPPYHFLLEVLVGRMPIQ